MGRNLPASAAIAVGGSGAGLNSALGLRPARRVVLVTEGRLWCSAPCVRYAPCAR